MDQVDQAPATLDRRLRLQVGGIQLQQMEGMEGQPRLIDGMLSCCAY